MALVYSLLLEDFSSVELKDTRDQPKNHQLSKQYFCGNNILIVEIRACPQALCEIDISPTLTLYHRSITLRPIMPRKEADLR
jgi:hypothetical protein